jgi:hypothetical protein
MISLIISSTIYLIKGEPVIEFLIVMSFVNYESPKWIIRGLKAYSCSD